MAAGATAGKNVSNLGEICNIYYSQHWDCSSRANMHARIHPYIQGFTYAPIHSYIYTSYDLVLAADWELT